MAAEHAPTMGELGRDLLETMLQLVDSDWSLRTATPAERGFCRVYRVSVERPGANADPRALYLKATPGENDGGLPADARILALLGGRTSIPVPEVFGAVDAHDAVPAPFFVMEAMPGTELPYERVGRLSESVLETLSRQVGEALGELHGIEGLDSFGHVTHDPGRELDGSRPSGTVADLYVDGFDTWKGFVQAWIDRELERHATSRFEALTPSIQEWSTNHLSRLDDEGRFPGEEGSPSPVLGRNDHGLHNLLVEESTGEVTGMLDWAYTLAVTPSFDFEYAVYLFGGAFLAGLPGVRDRRDLVREAMLAGYRSSAPDRAAAVANPTPLYELLAAVRVMNDFDQLQPRLPEGSTAGVADALAADVETLLEERP